MRYFAAEENLRRFYHYYPGAVAVIGVEDPKNGANFMPAVWNVGLSFAPPLFGVAVSPKRRTYWLIERFRRYSVLFFPYRLTDLVARLGSVSGDAVNKVEAFGLEVHWGRALKVPLLPGAYAAYELELADEVRTGDHTLFVGRVRGVWEDEQALDEEGVPTPERADPLLYYGYHLYGRAAPGLKRVKP